MKIFWDRNYANNVISVKNTLLNNSGVYIRLERNEILVGSFWEKFSLFAFILSK